MEKVKLSDYQLWEKLRVAVTTGLGKLNPKNKDELLQKAVKIFSIPTTPPPQNTAK